MSRNGRLRRLVVPLSAVALLLGSGAFGTSVAMGAPNSQHDTVVRTALASDDDDGEPDPGANDAIYSDDLPASLEHEAEPAAPEERAAAPTQRALRCAKAAKSAGFSGDSRVTAVAVALAESGCSATSKNRNPPTKGCPSGSLDRGAWQINSCYHKEVKDNCAYNVSCNARAAYTISNKGKSFQPWTTYKRGLHKKYLGEAKAAVNAT